MSISEREIYMRIEDLKTEMQSAGELYPLRKDLLQPIERSLNTAIKEVPLRFPNIWDKILLGLWDRMAREVYRIEDTTVSEENRHWENAR